MLLALAALAVAVALAGGGPAGAVATRGAQHRPHVGTESRGGCGGRVGGATRSIGSTWRTLCGGV